MINKVDEYEFTTSMTLREVEKKLNQAFVKMGVEQQENMRGSSAKIAVAVFGKTAVLSPFIFGVQVYVWDEGHNRTIQVNALGSGAGTFLRTSLKQLSGEYIDLKASRKKRSILLKIFDE